MKKGDLAPRDVLNCRLVNKWNKGSVDNVLCELKPYWLHPKSTSFSSLYHFIDFLYKSKGFTGNPFLSRHFSTHTDRTPFRLVMNILHRFGHELQSFFLCIRAMTLPEQAMDLLQALNLMPNIQRLSLRHHMINCETEGWAAAALQTSFPRLDDLKELELAYSVWNSRIPTTFFRLILSAYANQWTKLNLPAIVFWENGYAWSSICFPNLAHLEVNFQSFSIQGDETEIRRAKETYKNLQKLCCPKLQCLELSGRGMVMTAEAVVALGTFRNSLVELRLETTAFCGDCRELLQVDPADVKFFLEIVLKFLKIHVNSLIHLL